jgi:hypothetical protein
MRFGAHTTRVDRQDVRYARAVIQTYCPQHLESFDDFSSTLSTGSTR